MPDRRRENVRVQLGRAVLLVGQTQLRMRHLDQAEASFNQALTQARTFKLPGVSPEAVAGLGRVELARKQYGRALNHFNRALALVTHADAVPVMIPLYQSIAQTHEAQGRVAEALTAVRRSIELVEDVRSHVEESGLRSSYLENKQRLYEQAVRLALATGKSEEAFGFAEGSRARAFLDLLGTQTTLSKGKTRALVEEEVRLRARLAEADAEAEEADSDTEPEPTGRDVDAAARDYRAFLERVRKESLEQASLMTVEPVTTADVQALLPEGTTLLEYLVGEREVVGWVIDRQRVSVIRLPTARRALVRQVREFRAAIARQAPIEQIHQRGRTLYDQLVAAARPEIHGDRLLIVPHGVLHYLPFAALRTPEGRWLMEDYVLGTLPSASVLKYLAGKGEHASERALAIGNPDVGAGLNLRYAEREARLVGLRYPETATVLLRQDATEARVKTLSLEAGVIHFATHGELSEADPLASALLLVPGDEQDGRLEVREVFGLELNARLVVLSACETGLGRLSRGDELVGLQRAFLYAGTPAVITTLWRVDDRASFVLIRAFYEALAERGPAQALREAQGVTAKEYPHPFAWAAFGLTGVP